MRQTKIVATIGPASREPGRPRAAGGRRHGRRAAELRARQPRGARPDRAAHPRGRRAGRPRGGDPRRRARPEAPPRAGGGRRGRAGRGHAGGAHARGAAEGNSERLPVEWAGLAELVDEGDVCYLADGAIRLRVDEVVDSDVVTRVEVGGAVASRQGINLPNVTVSLPAVSDEDLRLIDAGLDMERGRLRPVLHPPPGGPRPRPRAPGGARQRRPAVREDREAAGRRQRRGADRRRRRGDDRPRRPGHRAADRGGPAGAEADPRAGRPPGQAHDHGHPDARVDGELASGPPGPRWPTWPTRSSTAPTP